MERVRARYDDHADWYEASLTGLADVHTRRVSRLLGEVLGHGSGVCLDLGCGTGHHSELLARRGWRPVGIDLSAAQLSYARARLPVALADAARLPFADGSVEAVSATHVHTDVDDWSAVCDEVARVLVPGGVLAYVGAHPCFGGAFAQRRPDGEVHLFPGYLETGLRFDGPALSPDSIRRRAGFHQRTLEALLTPLLESGLRLTAFREDADAPTPDLFGFRAQRC
jgi:SAM-dependent methyltransferase